MIPQQDIVDAVQTLYHDYQDQDNTYIEEQDSDVSYSDLLTRENIIAEDENTIRIEAFEVSDDSLRMVNGFLVITDNNTIDYEQSEMMFKYFVVKKGA